MIRIEDAPWKEMVRHARAAYPGECCGAMLGQILEDGSKLVREALPFENARADRERGYRYEVQPQALLQAEGEAPGKGMELLGLYHSHPDSGAHFSETDLKNSCPWFSYVILSIKAGEFDHAGSWLPDFEQTRADREELIY